ncbi:hypothetical protein A2U01_0078731, partial [Trifolium medium]|nr:hypothetical protein [Trifolium medium]
MAKPSQKVSGFLARTGEKRKTHLAWRATVSPGDITCRFMGSASNFVPSHAQIPSKQLI